jgi:uncharacterized protein (TIRG00374 family)
MSTGLIPAISVFIVALVLFAAITLIGGEKIQNSAWLRSDRRKKMTQKLGRLADLALSLTSHRGPLFLVFIVSIAIVIVRCFIFYCLYRAFGSAVPIFALMVFIPVMFVAVLLPISIGGLGVRETALVLLFGTFAVQAEVSVSVGIMFQFLQIVISIPGIVIWLSERNVDHHANRTPPDATSTTLKSSE